MHSQLSMSSRKRAQACPAVNAVEEEFNTMKSKHLIDGAWCQGSVHVLLAINGEEVERVAMTRT